MGRNYSSTSKSLNTTITHSHSALQFQSIWACAYHVCMVSASVCPPTTSLFPLASKAVPSCWIKTRWHLINRFMFSFPRDTNSICCVLTIWKLCTSVITSISISNWHTSQPTEKLPPHLDLDVLTHIILHIKKKGTRHWNDNKNIYSCRCKCITLISLFCFNIIGELRTKTIHLEFEFIFSVLSLL